MNPNQQGPPYPNPHSQFPPGMMPPPPGHHQPPFRPPLGPGQFPPGAPMPPMPHGMMPFPPPHPGMMPPPPHMMMPPPRPPKNLEKYSKPPTDLGEPNKTVYVRNLNEKISLFETKKALRGLFSQYGDVCDVLAWKNIRMRGQAFVVFKNVESAKKSMKIQGFPLFNRPMVHRVVMFAQKNSSTTAKLEGKLESWKRDHKKHAEERAEKFEESAKKALENGRAGIEKAKASGMPFGFPPPFQLIPDEMLPPNKILFVQNIPAEANEQMLSEMFRKFIGFREVRMVPGKTDIAFVEFNTEFESLLAKDALNGAQIVPDHLIKVTFARK